MTHPPHDCIVMFALLCHMRRMHVKARMYSLHERQVIEIGGSQRFSPQLNLG